MGYYSETAFALTAEAAEALREAISNQILDTALKAETFLQEAETHSIDGQSRAELFHWNAVKWYSEFEEIGCIERILRDLETSEYLFIRIGEDYSDIETKGSYWDNPFGLDIVRTVEFSGLSSVTAAEEINETIEETAQAV